MTDHSPSEGVPEAAEEVVQMRKEDFDELVLQARASASAPAPLVASSSSKPTFTKPGLARQFDFNSQILDILTPLVELAPAEFDIRSSLTRAISMLTQRNELITVGDKDPDVFEFYDKYSKAESYQSSNPILAAFLREKKKKEEKKPPAPTRTVQWKPRYQPYGPPPPQPFRQGRSDMGPRSSPARGPITVSLKGTSARGRLIK
ncbi:hypothetical protein ANCDUO_27378, partial [Ancylostoma duodenale]